MPLPATTTLPKPKSWDEFEDMCADLLKRVWRDPYVVRNGRSGQRQSGVDIYGLPEHLGGVTSGKYAGAQCKAIDVLTIRIVENEVEKARTFEPLLHEYLLLTTSSRDVDVQKALRIIQWPFRVHVWFWEDISLEICNYEDLLKKYYPNWLQRTTSKQDILGLFDAAEPHEFDYDDNTGIYVYTKDIRLRLVEDRSEWFNEGFVRDLFDEPWVHRFPDPHAYRQIVYIYYGETRIATEYCASVDGGRYIIPYPKSQQELWINPHQYHLGMILNQHSPGVGGFHFALSLAGIAIAE